MRSFTVLSGGVLMAAAFACTGPDRTFAPAGDTTGTGASGGGTTTTGSSQTGTGGNGGSGGQAGAGGQGGATGGGGSSNPCEDATHTCVPETAAGWTGPVSLYQGVDPGPACIGDFGTTIGEYNGQLDPGAASCDCTCDPAQGIVCSSPATLCYTSNCVLACFGSDASLPPGTCEPIPVSATTNTNVSDPPPTQMGSCTSQENHVLPTPTWGLSAKACGGAATSPVGCGAGDVCVPRVFAPDTMCVVHAGDIACPDAFYADKHVFYEGFDDTRACSACSCGAADSKCGGHVSFTFGGCGNILLNQVNAGSCGAKNNGNEAEQATYVPQPSGTCPPSGGVLSGAVVETGAVTFCCH